MLGRPKLKRATRLKLKRGSRPKLSRSTRPILGARSAYIVSGFLICVWNIKKTMKPILMKIEQNMSSSLSISWSLIWLWCSWLWMTNSICFHKWHWILIISQSYWNWLLKKKHVIPCITVRAPMNTKTDLAYCIF